MSIAAVAPTYQPGETIRIWLKDLATIDDGPVTSGATTLFEVVDRDGTVLSGGAGTAVGDDWHFDVNTPNVPGSYVARVTATVDAMVLKSSLRFYVEGF